MPDLNMSAKETNRKDLRSQLATKEFNNNFIPPNHENISSIVLKYEESESKLEITQD